jgi:site-specific DNA recombinase
MSKRAILYPRVSTDEQKEAGYGLPDQLRACRDYAARNDLEVVAEFCEDFTGTVQFERRPEGRKAYQMLKDGRADVLIAGRVNRLVRPKDEGDELDLLILIRNVMRMGGELHTVDNGKLDVSSFGGGIQALYEGRKAGDDRRQLIKQMKDGKREKARQGKPVGGMAPYGYTHERDGNGKVAGLVIRADEAQVVKLVYTWYVYGDGDGDGRPLTSFRIAQKLNEMGIPTSGQRRGKPACTLWAECQIRKLLDSETYAGVWRYGVRLGSGSHRDIRPPEEHITVAIPAIVDRELWEAVKERRSRNKHLSRWQAKRDYILRGMIKCGCGRNMVGWHDRRHRYYECSSATGVYKVRLEERPCRERMARADVLEAIAWDCVMEQFGDADRLARNLRIAQQEELDALAPKRDELATVEAWIAECEREAADYADELLRAPKEGLTRRTLEARAKEIDGRYVTLTGKRDKLQADLSRRTFTDEAIQATLQFREDVYLGMQDPDYNTKLRNLERLGVLVVVKDRQATVYCRALGSKKTVDIDDTRPERCTWHGPARCRRSGGSKPVPLPTF